MPLRLFGRSVATKYEELAASLGPRGCAALADPMTWAALLVARDEICRAYEEKINFHSAGRELWTQETFRLINDGYILGRIEVGTENERVSFSGVASQDAVYYEAGEFAMITSQAIAAGCGQGSFSDRWPRRLPNF